MIVFAVVLSHRVLAHLPRSSLFLGNTLLHSDMRYNFLAPARPSIKEVEYELPGVVAFCTAAACLSLLLGGLPGLLARRKRGEGPARRSCMPQIICARHGGSGRANPALRGPLRRYHAQHTGMCRRSSRAMGLHRCRAASQVHDAPLHKDVTLFTV